MSSLPTFEDFKMSFDAQDVDIQKYWDKELFKCPRCNEGVKRDYSVMYASIPPKYRYFCKSCGYSVTF